MLFKFHRFFNKLILRVENICECGPVDVVLKTFKAPKPRVLESEPSINLRVVAFLLTSQSSLMNSFKVKEVVVLTRFILSTFYQIVSIPLEVEKILLFKSEEIFMNYLMD
jgi:hypothetical protein